jgi:beta-N-acetylhexosaminidase
MAAFGGIEVPAWLARVLPDRPGVTLFGSSNVGSVNQMTALTAALQEASGTDLPLLIAADHEGGQLLGAGPATTPFPGNMALGAADDTELTEAVGRAMGQELRALGITVDYAPVCDLATHPDNPSLGIRAFGDDPARVGELAAAMVRGLQAEGVAAAAKHFPGKGDAVVDPHYELPVLDHDQERLEEVELVPFRAAVEAGARLVMVGHYALPAFTWSHDLPSSLSTEVVDGLLRKSVGFDGVVITDALNMLALTQGSGMVVDVIAALGAGVDLLLCADGEEQQEVLRSGLDLARRRRLIDPGGLERSADRVHALRKWLAGFGRPVGEVVGSAEHHVLANEVARRAITLVRDRERLLPLRPAADDTILAVMPRLIDLTPADTSSTVPPLLAASLAEHHPRVIEMVTTHSPLPTEVTAARQKAEEAALVVVGTVSAHVDRAQVQLVEALLDTGTPTVTVALRTPWDLGSYPAAGTHLCTYGIQPPAMRALAAALFGSLPTPGRLPVPIEGLYPRGHRGEL